MQRLVSWVRRRCSRGGEIKVDEQRYRLGTRHHRQCLTPSLVGFHTKDLLDDWAFVSAVEFTNNPDALLDGLDKVKAFYANGWEKRWERVLHAAAALPAAEGEAFLVALAKSHDDIADGHAWMKAFLDRGTPTSILAFIDLLDEGRFGRNHGQGVDAWHVGRQLGEHVERHPALRTALRYRYLASKRGPAAAVVEEFYGDGADEDDLLAMVEHYAGAGRPYDHHMSRAVEATAIWHEPVAEESNSYYQRPASVATLRKKLFELIGNSDSAELAKRCLTKIDELRDDHGIAANDPRHPDVGSGKLWPLELLAPVIGDVPGTK